MPPFAFAPVTIRTQERTLLASAPPDGQRWSFRASQAVSEGQSFPSRSGRASPDMRCTNSSWPTGSLRSARSASRRRRIWSHRRRCGWGPLVRGRRFAAVDANAHLIPRCGVSPSCQKVRTVIKSLSVCPRGHYCCLGWADLSRVGCASITFPQWRSVDFLPLRWHTFLAMPRKSSARHPPLTLRPRAVRVDRPSAC
jgi:hypothetical protein